jgi:hypothetical protein
MQQSHQNRYRCIPIAILGMLIFAVPASYVCNRYALFVDYKKHDNVLITFLENNALHRSIYFFSTEFYAYPIVDYVDVTSASRFPFIWILPGIFKSRLPTDTQIIKDKNFLINMISEDLNKNKPFLVFVDIRKLKPCMSIPKMINHKINLTIINFDYLNYFLSNNNFREAWKKYRYLTKLTIKDNAKTDEFDVYRRI